ncbi:serine hydrolase domain-containing protein [Streptomyces cyaneofuscatus]|uniref:serine hydrolase domain-containing protein n=1 Tax=Streptomyces cyaneofuscatus TaxID=66883 RepID=UPI0037B59982
MSQKSLAAFVAKTAEAYGLPGAAVGIWAAGQETYACHGVTSVDHALPVDEQTLFLLGSVSKTYTATALMRLAANGQVDLDAPVRRYVPELVLPDEQATAEITVFQLLNHTAGLDWRMAVDTGEGDDALAAYVANMADSELIAQPGTRASYSQIGYNLAGRIIEKVTGQTYEQAIAALLFEPLGLEHTALSVDDVMTRRFAVGHNVGDDGGPAVVRQWKDSRANNPGGGAAASAADLLRWARFHLGDGRTQDGTPLLPAGAVQRMRQESVELRGSALGDAFGVCWFLREVEGLRTVGHGGSANGQFAELLIVPEHDFAVVVLSNAGPDTGMAFNQAALRWALEHHLGVVERTPEPIPYDESRAHEVAGSYENELMKLTIVTDGAELRISCDIKPEIRAAAGTELPPDLPPAGLGLLPGHADEYIVTSGGLTGQRGFFTRDDNGTITGADLAGRLFTLIPADR